MLAAAEIPAGGGGIVPDGLAPTPLCYGGSDLALTLEFSVANLHSVRIAGVLGVPGVRGGAYRESWHQAGTEGHREDEFARFVAAALEWLIAHPNTSPRNLAGVSSNARLRVAVVRTQRLGLSAAAPPLVGVAQVRHLHNLTHRKSWTLDNGPVDHMQAFKALYSHAPLRHLNLACHPMVLVTTADYDEPGRAGAQTLTPYAAGAGRFDAGAHPDQHGCRSRQRQASAHIAHRGRFGSAGFRIRELPVTPGLK